MSRTPKGGLMSISGLSPTAPMVGRKPSTYKTRVVPARRRVLKNSISGRALRPSNEPVVANFSVPSDF